MGVPVYQYDPTVKAPPVSRENFHFRSVAWSSIHSFQSRTLDTMLEENQLTRCSDLLLKFDAEGAEWDAFDKQKEETLKQFRVIVGEFHGLHQLADSAFLRLASEVFSKLTIFHTAVHLHANNCCGFVLIEGIPIPKVVEITFLRNDRSNTFEPSRDPIPSALDYPNMPSRPDLHLNPFG